VAACEFFSDFAGTEGKAVVGGTISLTAPHSLPSALQFLRRQWEVAAASVPLASCHKNDASRREPSSKWEFVLKKKSEGGASTIVGEQDVSEFSRTGPLLRRHGHFDVENVHEDFLPSRRSYTLGA